jgi:hypothetical protein
MREIELILISALIGDIVLSFDEIESNYLYSLLSSHISIDEYNDIIHSWEELEIIKIENGILRAGV